MPSPLPTDFLLWLLIGAVALYGWYCARRPHLAAPWKRVFQSKAAVVSAVVLGGYILIGFADSLHFRPRLAQAGSDVTYSPEVLSVLDLALSPLRQRRERTYSAPLATRLYSKEQMQVEGKTVRDFPRLAYGGVHLKDEADQPGDVALRIGL
jgi:peptide/nickel transport system permease protein